MKVVLESGVFDVRYIYFYNAKIFYTNAQYNPRLSLNLMLMHLADRFKHKQNIFSIVWIECKVTNVDVILNRS